MTTTRFYAAQKKTSFLSFCADFGRFLINDLASFTGPGWEIVEAYDNDCPTTKRRVPTGGDEKNMDNASFSAGSDFGWQQNSVGANDWIVLESVLGGGATEFQVFFKVTGTTTMTIQLMPKGDFVTGGGDTPSPTLPSTTVPASAPTITGYTTSTRYSIVADEGMFAFLFDALSLTGCNWTYVGQVDGAPADDDYPYIIWDTPGQVVFNDLFTTTGNWHRLSPVNADLDGGDSLLTLGLEAHYYQSVTSFVHASTTLGVHALDQERPLPVGVFFPDAGHRHFAGWLRNVYSANRLMGATGTFGNKSYMFRNEDPDGSTGVSLCFAWDGSTAYPPTS